MDYPFLEPVSVPRVSTRVGDPTWSLDWSEKTDWRGKAVWPVDESVVLQLISHCLAKEAGWTCC